MAEPQSKIFETLSRRALVYCHPSGWTDFCAESLFRQVGGINWLRLVISVSAAIEAGFVEENPTDHAWCRLTDAGRAARERLA